MNIDFRVLLQYLPDLTSGFLMTIVMVVGSILIGAVIGIIACVGKLLRQGPLFWISAAYIDIFRTLPEIVTIFWIYTCLPLIFDLRLGSVSSGLLALSLVAGAYLAEIFRAGILAIPRGQIEAAYSLGIPQGQIWFQIVAPQAARTMVPTFILLLTDHVKGSALLSTISVSELMYQATVLSGMTYRYFEFFTGVGIAYFALIFPLSIMAQTYERRFHARRR